MEQVAERLRQYHQSQLQTVTLGDKSDEMVGLVLHHRTPETLLYKTKQIQIFARSSFLPSQLLRAQTVRFDMSIPEASNHLRWTTLAWWVSPLSAPLDQIFQMIQEIYVFQKTSDLEPYEIGSQYESVR